MDTMGQPDERIQAVRYGRRARPLLAVECSTLRLAKDVQFWFWPRCHLESGERDGRTVC